MTLIKKFPSSSDEKAPNEAADKPRAAKAQAKRSAEASVSFIRWMGGRERKPVQRIYPPRR